MVMITIKQAIKTPDEPPEGSWRTKVPLGHAISKSIHSCPMVKDKHLAVSYVEKAFTVLETLNCETRI